MKATLKPRVVEADEMANGNWLVEDGHDRRVYLPEDFHARFEIIEPRPLCPNCHTTPYELVTNGPEGAKREIKCTCP